MLTINSKHDKITENVIHEFEGKFCLEFPLQYKRFLLDYNGGKAIPNMFEVPNINEEQQILSTLYGINTCKYHSDLLLKYEVFEGVIPKEFVAIGSTFDGDQICLGVEGDYKGKIYVWVHDTAEDLSMDALHFLSNDFKSFLTKLQECR